MRPLVLEENRRSRSSTLSVPSSIKSLLPSNIALDGVVPEEFLDKVDVGHDHSAAAVAVQAEQVHGVTRRL
jgi:hypothetical protein